MSDFTLENTCLKKGCLAGEVAVITGSTSNVGKGYAQALAWAGAKVVIVGRNETKGNKVAAMINEDNGPDTAIFVKTDVSKAEDIQNLKEKAIEKFGKVDILINNAMNMALCGPILGSPVEELDEAYAISGRAVMLAVNAFVPDMIKRGHGTVTYSTTQFHYIPGMLGGSIYTASKSCATSVIMSLANEVQGTGVNVFCITPAGVGVPETKGTDKENGDLPDELDGVKMPGFPGLVPIDAAGAGMVYALTRADEIHGTGHLISDVLIAMDYPFPCPETAVKRENHYLDGIPLTLAFCYMGHGFPEKK